MKQTVGMRAEEYFHYKQSSRVAPLRVGHFTKDLCVAGCKNVLGGYDKLWGQPHGGECACCAGGRVRTPMCLEDSEEDRRRTS